MAAEPIEALHRIDQQTAVMAVQLAQVVKHLEILNGRVGKAEERLSALEMVGAEARGAWKLFVLATSIPAGVIGAVAAWVVQHSGGK